MNRQFQKLTLFCALLGFSFSSAAQVTIGSGFEPTKGALLDLKEKLPATGNNTTATKGLLLPRVNLTDPNKLYPMFPDASTYDGEHNDRHIGLEVYNMSDQPPFCPGVYVWDGTVWMRLQKDCPPTSTINFYPNYNTYTGALPPTPLVNNNGAFLGTIAQGDTRTRGTGVDHSEKQAGVFHYTDGSSRSFPGFNHVQDGIRVRIAATTLAAGDGELPVLVSGTPAAATAGKAFDIPVTLYGHQLYVRVNVGFGAYTTSFATDRPASIPKLLSAGGDPAWLQFQGYNLGASTSYEWNNHEIGNSTGGGGTLGWLFQWGRPADGHQLRDSGTDPTPGDDTPGHDKFITSTTPGDWHSSGNNDLWDDGTPNKTANDPCPAGWRVPSQAQWNSIFNGIAAPSTATTNTWYYDGDSYHGGYWVGSSMYLPGATYRERNGNPITPNYTIGYYWSRTAAGTQSNYLNFGISPSEHVDAGYGTYIFRADGLSVRCVAYDGVEPNITPELDPIMFVPNFNIDAGSSTFPFVVNNDGKFLNDNGNGDSRDRGTEVNHNEMQAGVFRYTVGDGRSFPGLTVEQHDIKVRIEAATLNTGEGELEVFVSGKPKDYTAGKAFDIPVTIYGEQLYVRVNVGFGAYTQAGRTTSPLTDPTDEGDPAWLQFQGYNLGVEDTTAHPWNWDEWMTLDDAYLHSGDPSQISDEFLGGIVQWGRLSVITRNADYVESTTPPSIDAFDETLGKWSYFINTSNSDAFPDWWPKSGYGTSNLRWGNGTQNVNVPKTAKDPCPAGWKVPSQAQWGSIFRGGAASGMAGTATANTWTGAWHVLELFSGCGGCEVEIPYGGFYIGSSLYLPGGSKRHNASYGRSDFTDDPNNAGPWYLERYGFYWSSTTNGDGAYCLRFDTDEVKPGFTDARSHGLSVRCVADK